MCLDRERERERERGSLRDVKRYLSYGDETTVIEELINQLE